MAESRPPLMKGNRKPSEVRYTLYRAKGKACTRCQPQKLRSNYKNNVTPHTRLQHTYKLHRQTKIQNLNAQKQLAT